MASELKVLEGHISQEEGKLIYYMKNLECVQKLMEILTTDEGMFIMKSEDGTVEVVSCDGKIADVKAQRLIIKGGTSE